MDATLIPALRFETANLPVDQQFAAWAAFTANSHVTRPGTGAYSAAATFWQLHGMVVSLNTADAFTMDRDDRHLATSSADHFLIVLPLDGESHFTAPGMDERCTSGDIVVANLNRPGRCANSDGQTTIAISMARHFLEDAAGAVDVHGRLMPSPEARLFISFMRALVDQLPSTTEARVAPLSRIVRDLFANIVAGLPRSDSPAEAVALPARARAYMRAQPPGTLDVDAMVAALGTTRSTLFRLFRGDGGVLRFDRNRRLRLVHRAVADPLDHRSLTEIGFAHGFDDSAQLARQFRATFGYSMTALRSQIDRRTPSVTSDGRSAADRYRALMATLN